MARGERARGGRGRGVLWGVAVVVVLGVAVGVTAALGGFRAAPVRTPTARAGTPIDNGQLVITPRAARFLRKDPTTSTAPERGRYLAVAFRVTNVSQETTGADEAMSSLRMAVTGKPAGTPLNTTGTDLVVGAGRHSSLQPDIRRGVLMVAELPRNVPVPREVVITIHRAEYRPGFMDEHKTWWGSDEIAAEVTVPVRSAR